MMQTDQRSGSEATSTGSFLPVALFFVSVVAFVKAITEATSGHHVLVSFLGPAPTAFVLFGMSALGAVWFMRGQVNWPFRKILALVLFALPLAGLLGTIQGTNPGTELAGGSAGHNLAIVLRGMPVVLGTGLAGFLVLVTTIMSWRLAFQAPSTPESAESVLAQALARQEDQTERQATVVEDAPDLPMEAPPSDEDTGEESEAEEEPELLVAAARYSQPEPEPIPAHLDTSRVLAGALREETPVEAPAALAGLTEESVERTAEAEANFRDVEAREAAPVTAALTVDEDTALPPEAFVERPEPVEEPAFNPVALAAAEAAGQVEGMGGYLEETSAADAAPSPASAFADAEEELEEEDLEDTDADEELEEDVEEEDLEDADEDEELEEDVEEEDLEDADEDEELEEDVEEEDLEDADEDEELEEDVEEEDLEDADEDEELEEDVEEEDFGDADEDEELEEDVEEEDFGDADEDEELEEDDEAEEDEEFHGTFALIEQEAEAVEVAVTDQTSPEDDLDTMDWEALERATRPDAGPRKDEPVAAEVPEVVARPQVMETEAAFEPEAIDEPSPIIAAAAQEKESDSEPVNPTRPEASTPSPAEEPTVESPSSPAPAPSGRAARQDWATWEDESSRARPAKPAAAVEEDDDEIQPVLFAHRSEVDDSDYDRAVALVTDEDRCSVALLQRSLSVSFSEATAMIERMYDEGIVGPPLPSGRREILVSRENNHDLAGQAEA